MERLKAMKNQLIAEVQTQLNDIHHVDAKELGEAVDMIKDIAMTEYYCSIVKAMEEAEEEKEMRSSSYYYTERYMPIEYQRHMDSDHGRMYYMPRYYDEHHMDMDGVHDMREGGAGPARRSYMDGKAMHHEKEVQMKELDRYMQELSNDITEMIHDASPEEKQLLHKKLSALTGKIEVLSKE